LVHGAPSNDLAHHGIERQTLGVIDVLVTGKPAEYRLTQEARFQRTAPDRRPMPVGHARWRLCHSREWKRAAYCKSIRPPAYAILALMSVSRSGACRSPSSMAFAEAEPDPANDEFSPWRRFNSLPGRSHIDG